MSAKPAAPSIHRQRRWFYVLWSALLLLSATALVLWETPGQRGEGKVAVSVTVKGAPEGAQIRAWVGPEKQRRQVPWESLPPLPLKADQRLGLPPLRISMTYRRWGKDYIPRATMDTVLLRLEAPNEPPRYILYSLRDDLYYGLLRPRRTLSLGLPVVWSALRTNL